MSGTVNNLSEFSLRNILDPETFSIKKCPVKPDII